MSRSREEKIDDSQLPDGGWGWMIVLGVALTNMFNQSLISVFGLLFGQRLEQMGHETAGVSLVSNVNSMVMCFSGLVTGPVLSRYSCRSVTLFGSVLTFFGLIMCSYADTIGELLLYYSFLTGLGLGLIYPASFVTIKAYFVARRGRAVGISMAGTGIGQMLMPQLVRLLLDEYGFEWTVRIVGALCLHGVVGAMLYQPVRWHLKPLLLDSEKLINNNNDLRIKMDEKSDKYNETLKKSEASQEKLHIEEQNDEPKPYFLNSLSSSLGLSLLLDPSFTNLCIGVGMVHTAGVTFGMIFPFLLMESPSLMLSRADTALCMSLLSASDIIARLTIPMVTYYMGLSSRMTFMAGALLLAGARSIIAVQSSLGPMIAASLLTGYIRAITVINQNLTISEHCSMNGYDDRLPAALGLMMVAKGIFVITLGQLLGWLRDYTKSYTLFIYGTNALLIFVFLSWLVEYIITRMRRKKSLQEETN